KRQSALGKVRIIAHSFGGILARSYIESDYYGNDVAQLVTLGTPHQGSLKAYPVWAGGEIPQDWSFLESLLRWYRLQDTGLKSNYQTIEKYIPSVQSLLPTYPAWYWGTIKSLTPAHFLHARNQNKLVQGFDDTKLLSRTSFITI